MKRGTRLGKIGGWSTLFRTEPKSLTLDIALIAVRIALAWVFVYYGAQKLFGAFNGLGFHGTALYFSHTAHLRPGGLFAALGGVTEFGGGIAIALGFCSRLAALALFADQVIAMITVTWATGFGSLNRGAGYQFNVTLAVLALVVVALGAGRLSVDDVISRRLRAAGVSSSSSSPPSPGGLHHQKKSGSQVASSIGTNDPD
ncbi:MAG: DoxX family protein [Acidimicrobiales bacterium]|nr:DoxX family protein [Acidimicrobiales bacterium]